MNKPNIFKISHRIGLEDKFTASLCYLLNKHQEVGQAYLDRLCELTGSAKTRFMGATDHPDFGTLENRPDFLLKGESFSILVEHKIESDLGDQQLERYLALAESHNLKLCLISNVETDVPSSVRNSPRYLRPSDRKHILWSAFYETFRALDDSFLVVEFLEWMTDLGMNPNLWKGHGDPFVDPIAIAKFFDCHKDMKVFLESSFGPSKGRSVRPGRKNACIEIRKPTPFVWLAYMSLKKLAEDDFFGCYLQVYIAMKKPNMLADISGVLDLPLGSVRYLAGDLYAGSYPVRIYYLELSKVLDEKLKTTKSNLELMLEEVLKHVEGEANQRQSSTYRKTG